MSGRYIKFVIAFFKACNHKYFSYPKYDNSQQADRNGFAQFSLPIYIFAIFSLFTAANHLGDVPYTYITVTCKKKCSFDHLRAIALRFKSANTDLKIATPIDPFGYLCDKAMIYVFENAHIIRLP